MGYRNDNTGYRDDILQNRSVVKRNWAVIEPDGCVKNVIPGFENCDVTILGSPKLGGAFVDYLLTVHEGGKNARGWGQPGEKLFIYFFDGTVWLLEPRGSVCEYPERPLRGHARRGCRNG